jgi:hypothetical protein
MERTVALPLALFEIMERMALAYSMTLHEILASMSFSSMASVAYVFSAFLQSPYLKMNIQAESSTNTLFCISHILTSSGFDPDLLCNSTVVKSHVLDIFHLSVNAKHHV